MAEPNPSNVAPWYLRDVCQALQLDELSGNVFMRTGIQGNVYITGPVTVPAGITITGGNSNVVVTSLPSITGNVNANITGGNSNVVVTSLPTVNAHITGGNSNVAVTGNVSVIGNVGILGNIAGITSFPSITGNVNANITGGNSNVVVTSLPNIAGNVNANVSGNVGIIGNVAVTQATSPWVVSGNLALPGTVETTIVGTNLDAFGRLRISNPYTLFDSALSGERRNDFSSQTANGGQVTFNYNANVRNLIVNSSVANSSVVRESMLTFPYQPGKSLLIMHSVVFADWTYGATQKAGFFGASNGIYFQQVGKILSFVIRSSSSGSLTEEVVTQANWNGDPLNGSGPSGITLDMAATQLLWQDIEWLGVGSVRCGFVIDGQFIVCHTFNHANDPTYTTTYMGSAILPLRYEIISTGVGIGNATMQQICSTVISEGGYDQSAFTYTAGTGVNTLRLVSAGTYYPIASIRLDSGYLNSIVKVAQVDILSPTVNYYRWAILKNATLTGATWASSSSTTRVDVDTAATAVTGGIEIQSGYASSRENVFIGATNFYARLGRTVTGVSDTFTLVLSSTNNNSDVCAQLGWQEIL